MKPLSVWRPVGIDDFLVGVPHYPEHIDESDWERDAQRMVAAGFNTIRMAEFAWHLMEPNEGEFDFGLFDRAVELFGKRGINSILCTPTATPPRWLTYKYPEVLRVDRRGRVMSHGSRQHADTASPVYREHSKRITRAMAEHFAANSFVIGWQTDNEFNTSMSESYSVAAALEFQQFLKARYQSIEALNHAWGGNFWATAYDGFEQVVLPVEAAPVAVSPGHYLDYQRFLAFATARFQHDQVQILRAVNKRWFVFHNLGELEAVDFRGQFSTDVDFLGFDIYPMLRDELSPIGGHAEHQALHLDLCRAPTGNFIVPEQQSGFGSQPNFCTLTPEPGEMRRMAWSSVSRGADGLLFFRWRPAHFGAEIYWMGLIDHDNVPRRRYREAQQFATEIHRIKHKLLGTCVHMDVGIAGSDYDNEHAHQSYPMGLPSPMDDATLLHRYCYQRGISCGFIHPDDDLSQLKVLYVPHWLIWPDIWSARVEAFVRDGGTVIIGARTGSRDEHNHVIKTAAPGPSLSALAGVEVEEFGRLAGPEASSLGSTLGSQAGRLSDDSSRLSKLPESSRRRYTLTIGNHEVVAGHLYELLTPLNDTQVIGRWSNRFADGQAAVTLREVAKGRAVYVGTYLTEQILSPLFDTLLVKSGVQPLIAELPEGVEISLRRSEQHRLLFVLNTRDEPADVQGLPAAYDLLSENQVKSGKLVLGGYGCAVLEL